MPRPFVHLHNHTEYSLLDGANRVPELVAKAKEFEMPAVAITDHGVMFGAMEFYWECKRQGVKPLIGMEAYVAPNGRHKKSGREENETRHLLLLARNETGYQNLCRLHSIAALEGFYYKPRIDHEALRDHASGLIASTTCIGSEVNQALLDGNFEQAERIAAMYKDMFDEGCYFVELQDHGIPEQQTINKGLVEIAKKLNLPLVATNDAHYLCKGDAEPHDVLLCIGTGHLREDPKRLRFPGPQFFIKSADEMAALFPDQPEAIENSLMFAEMCELELGKAQSLMPEPDMPEGETATSHLRNLAIKGLQERTDNPTDQDFERLEYELGVIERTGFEAYFLLVREFARFTRDNGIQYGVRGSAAGSLVSYTIGITDVNPVEYDLTFERFLNPERVSMPDIDMDFEDARRDEVIRWVQGRYGQDRVAQIVTFGTLGAKAAIKDAGRVMGIAPQDTDRICKTIPTGPGWSIQRAEKEVAEFRACLTSDKRFDQLVKTAKSIEGLARHAGVHAAGVVISREPLSETVPLYRSADGQPVTAYDMGVLEKIGLLKMDFLGLSNLTVLARTLELLGKRDEVDPNKPGLSIRGPNGLAVHIPEDDGPTFDALGRGESVGVFQLESGGMRRAVMAVKPRNVRELAALIALYRPGPMEHIPRYVEAKHGRAPIEYLHERMAAILEETFGVIVYQDQVLKLVQALAGFSLGRADILRRAMGKKDAAVMASMQTEFATGCAERGVEKAVADRVWELLLPFAGYAFNKAHAVCYAILAYQTAYLKTNFPVEYMAALLAVFREKEDRVTAFIEECRRCGIRVLPPSVESSQLDFSIEETADGPAIRFGLGAVKGIGDALVRAILEDRKSGPYTHIFEFAERNRPSGLTRSSLEAFIKAGALDCIDRNRNTLTENLEAALAFADIAHRNKMTGQDSLFASDAIEPALQYPVLPEEEPFDRRRTLAMEKEVLGIYVSDHPLRGYHKVLQANRSHTCSMVEELDDGATVRLSGVVSGVREIVTRSKGERMATITLEDFSGQTPCTLFPATFAKFKGIANKDTVVRLKGTVSFRQRPGASERTIEVLVDEMAFLPEPDITEMIDHMTPGTVAFAIPRATKEQLEDFRERLSAYRGDFEVLLDFEGTEHSLTLIERIDPAPENLAKICQAVPGSKAEVHRNDDWVGPSDTARADKPVAVEV